MRDLKVVTATADLSTLPVGTWQVRVRGIDAGTIEGYDSIRQVNVRVPDRWRVTGSRLNLQQSALSARLVGPSGSATGISAVVTTDAQSANVVGRPTSCTAQFDLGPLKPGSYYLRLTNSHPPAVIADRETCRLNVRTGWGSTILDIESALQPLRP